MNRKKEPLKKNRIRKTPKETLKLKVKILKTWAEKTKGLSGIAKIYPVYFETRFGIHTFGMKKPIDILILDDDNRIVKINKNMKPGNVFFWNPKYSRVIEVMAGKYKVNISDKVQIS